MRSTLFVETECWKLHVIWLLGRPHHHVHLGCKAVWPIWSATLLSINPLSLCQAKLKSALCVMYLDNVTIGGSLVDILHDLNIIKEAKVLDLTLWVRTSQSSFVKVHQSKVYVHPLCYSWFPSDSSVEGYLVGLLLRWCCRYWCFNEAEYQGFALDGCLLQIHIKSWLPHFTAVFIGHSESTVCVANWFLFLIEGVGILWWYLVGESRICYKYFPCRGWSSLAAGKFTSQLVVWEYVKLPTLLHHLI